MASCKVCITFRMVNRDIVNNDYHMFWIDKHFKEITGTTVFTNLDLTKGYQQLLIHLKYITSRHFPCQTSFFSKRCYISV